MTALTFNDLKTTLKVGDRVCFPHGADMYPTFHFDDRLNGTVSEVDTDNASGDNMVWIRLDSHKEELDEWDNQIQVYLYEEDELAFEIERLLSSEYDEEDKLGEFIRRYCAAHGIRVDGDAFGMMFSGVENEWTETEAAALIEAGARIYGLRT